MTAIGELTEVSFGYNKGVTIIDRVSASFDEGRVCAVAGPSGCGKSTILSLLGLLLRPNTGDVTVLGENCSHLSDRGRSLVRRHHVGFVFQDALLETSMTVWQNLHEALPPGSPSKPARAKAQTMLEMLALPGDLLDRRAIGLSGGQAQRVAVIRALLKEPALVLADEPTGNLDDTSGNMVLNALFEFGRQPGHACVIVTHDPRIVERADTELRIGGTT